MNKFWIEQIFKNGLKVNIINPTRLYCSEQMAKKYATNRTKCHKLMGGSCLTFKNVETTPEEYSKAKMANIGSFLEGNEQVQLALDEELGQATAYYAEYGKTR